MSIQHRIIGPTECTESPELPPAYAVVTVTIGRNIGSKPMDETDWENFTEDIKSAVESSMGFQAHDMSESKDGPGVWDMQEEESRSLKWFYPSTPSVYQAKTIRRRLGQVRAAYSQDAVALEFGVSELI